MCSLKTDTVSLDEKNIMFIGNSFVYYGNCIVEGNQGDRDEGYFYQIAKANGEKTTVIDYVYGGRNLEYIYTNFLPKDKEYYENFDYVFISEAGENNQNLVSDCKKIIDLFPQKTSFFYLCHEYTYKAKHSNIINSFPELENMGVRVVNWGKLVYDIWNGFTDVPGATLVYDRHTFIKNNKGFYNGSGAVGEEKVGDKHHQNLLSGYITALMAYCAVTGKSAVGQPYGFCDDKTIHKYFDIDTFIKAHYNGVCTTNFDKVFRSDTDMKGIQMLIDEYISKK